ncbi:hypothetical protein [Clostridium estertheticum]|uniref:hypothetical protein n=1 Tax=Clostridium estertheticum TaxID=238834 RepID=UPI001CF58947|nr:hypothetical protein [Clostridium estertheticum]MCB2339726.1 hypothetical protein [Clostridium estertheticum]
MKTKKILISLLAVLFCTLVIGYFAKDTIIKKVMHYQIKDKIVCKVNSNRIILRNFFQNFPPHLQLNLFT